MTTYEKQALDFLKATSTKMTISFDGYKKHFQDDTKKRNVYKITLKRDGKQYTFAFGDSIKNTEDEKKPTEYDILACLSIFECDFCDFCDDFGYDKDKKAKKTYESVKRESKNIKRIFTEEQIELLQEIN